MPTNEVTTPTTLPPRSWRDRLIPMIVASPLFLQNLDTSVMATALPSIARSLAVEPLHLNLAITAYLLSLAVFLPVSGWCADRFGARRVFCAAIGFFALGSALCGAAFSLEQLVVYRILQGLGGAMMVPTGRLILLRSVPKSQMVAAMVWFTVPPVFGRMAGPLFGGLIVTWTSWRWIFLVNVPFGLLAIAMAMHFVPDSSDKVAAEPPPFDRGGFVLLALTLSGLLGALELIGKHIAPDVVIAALALVGAGSAWLYVRRSLHMAEPLIDLRILRFRAFRASVIGGMPIRVAVGASPFLLPLMFQLGFGYTPMQSGLMTVATAVGSLCTRPLTAYVLRNFRFRTVLVGCTVGLGLSYASYGLFTPASPYAAMFVALMIGGLVNSMALVALSSMGFSSVPKPRLSHATALSVMSQQLSLSIGVVFASSLVAVTAWWHGGDSAHLTDRDFHFAFFAIGFATLLSLLSFVRLAPDEGADLKGGAASRAGPG